MPLTDKHIKNAKPGLKPARDSKRLKETRGLEALSTTSSTSTNRKFETTHKPYKLSDAHGLYIEIDPSGGKYWRYKYRFGGKEKRLSLGIYPEVSLADARIARDALRKQLTQGIDPGVHRKAQKATRSDRSEDSFEAVGREWYGKFIEPMAKNHRTKVLARLVNDVFPAIGHRPIQEIKPKEVLDVVLKIEERGAGDTAHRTLGTCSQIFRYGVSTSRCESDVCRDLRGALSPVKEKHFAAVTDPEQLGGILRALYGYKGTFVVQCALKLVPLLFVRPGELRGAKWPEFDLEEARWLFKKSKNRENQRSSNRSEDIDEYLIVPLAHQAVRILRDLHALTGDGEFVFPAHNSRKRQMSENTVNAALRRMGIDQETTTGHGFRATARTILRQQLHVQEDYIEHQLGHLVRDPNGRAYNRATYLPERRLMMQAWADYLDKLRLGEKVPSAKPKLLTDLRVIQVPGYQ
jgi:integrase